jgi:hypothetical protein
LVPKALPEMVTLLPCEIVPDTALIEGVPVPPDSCVVALADEEIEALPAASIASTL